MAEKQKQKDSAPAAQQRDDARKVSIEFALPQFDSAFQLKLPFLAILLLVFAFSLYLLASSQVLSTDWFSDFAHIENRLLPRFSSAGFILFTLLISLCFALSSFFGIGQSSRMHAVFVLCVTMVPALAMGLLFSASHPNYTAAFIALSLGVSSAAYFSAKKDRPTKTEIWYAIGNALTFFAVVAFITTFAVASANNDAFFDKLFLGMASAAPTTLHEVAKAGASAVENYQVDNETITALVTEKDAEMLYNAMRDSTLGGASGTVRVMLEGAFPTFANLNDSMKKSLTDGLKRSLVTAFPTLKKKVADGLREYANAEAQQPTPAQLAQLKTQLSGMPQFALLKIMFPIALAFLLNSVISLLRFFVRPIAVLATMGLLAL
ncbi:MAG: hypothetical protein WC792_01390 [Candidatus Micrarchaeia archaeon]|jgi:hypothetical protein